MSTKSIFASKTFWVNLIVGFLAIFNQEFLTSVGVTGQTQMVIITLINLFLRFFTKKEVTVLPQSENKKPV